MKKTQTHISAYFDFILTTPKPILTCHTYTVHHILPFKYLYNFKENKKNDSMKELFILLLACLFSSTADAQYLYGLDPTFGNNGIYEGDTGGVFKIAVQPDKKIIIVGQDIKNYAYNNVIKRFKEDGEFDSSFSNSGVFLVNTNTSSSNQKIVSSIY